MSIPLNLTIASRESRLALWQAEHIRNLLQQNHRELSVKILGMTTQGDQILDRPLTEIGGKGLFIKELEVAMQKGLAQLAVHSMKDVPMEMPEGFLLAAVCERENPLDALVSNRYSQLSELPAGAVVGTSSVRREALLRARYPKLLIRSLRGNLDTRLRKLDEGQFDAIILASAGLIRLGMKDRIKSQLSDEESLPAPGQGALGIEIFAHTPDLAAIKATIAPLNHLPSALCVYAERAFSRTLGGSCQLPLGAYAKQENENLTLKGFVALRDGSQMIDGMIQANITTLAEADELGKQLAIDLLQRGAQEILSILKDGIASSSTF